MSFIRPSHPALRALLLALLMCAAALHPLWLAAAHAGGDRPGQILLCTAQGMQWVQIDADLAELAGPETSTDDALDAACPWCIFHHHLLALPLGQEQATLASASQPRTLRLPPWQGVFAHMTHAPLPARGPPQPLRAI